jgi:hypothetical protein
MAQGNKSIVVKGQSMLRFERDKLQDSGPAVGAGERLNRDFLGVSID